MRQPQNNTLVDTVTIAVQNARRLTPVKLLAITGQIRIRLVLFLNMAVLLLLILGSGYLVMQRHITNDIYTLSRAQLTLLADTIHQDILDLKKAGSSMAVLKSTFKSLRKQHREILELRFIRAKATERQFGISKEFQPHDKLELDGLNGKQPKVVLQEGGHRDVIRFIYPLNATRACLSCHQAKPGERLGALSITYDVSRVTRYIRKNALKMQLISLVEIILIFASMTYLLNRLIFKRLLALHAGADRIARGDLSTYVEGASHDEAGLLVQAFNRMTRRLKELIDERDEKIRSQGNELAFLLEMSDSLNNSQSITEMLQQFARMVTESVKVTCCRIAILDEGAQTITCKANFPIHLISEHVEEEEIYSKTDCPHLWHVIENQSQYLLHNDDELSERERELLLFDHAQTAFCMPLVGKKMLGMIILIEFRKASREPITDDKIRYCSVLMHQLAAGIENGVLRERLLEHSRESIMAMAETVDLKSRWTSGHSRRVTGYAVSIGRKMSLDKEQMQNLRTAGLLHDIGKIGTPGAILNKPGRLSDDERAVINRHPGDGAHLLSKMKYFNAILPAVRHHHERYDGGGYPDGLKGEAIPLAARILAVADSYDAMVSDRPYRAGLDRDTALAELEKGKGVQFDPQVVDVFVSIIRSRHSRASGNAEITEE